MMQTGVSWPLVDDVALTKMWGVIAGFINSKITPVKSSCTISTTNSITSAATYPAVPFQRDTLSAT